MHGGQEMNGHGWKTIPASNMARSQDNPIRRIVDCMKLEPNPDKDMIALSIGDPTVFGNLPVCASMLDAVQDSLRSGKYNGYAPSTGYENARLAVAEKYACPQAPITSKDVILTSGCSSALDMAISVLANPGQNILIPKPGFSIYRTVAVPLGIHVKYYSLLPEQSWEIDLDDLQNQIDGNTACIVVNNPSNPCGSVYSRRHIRDILAVANRYRLPVIADEVYADFVFTGQEYISMASETSDVPILSCGGLTKRYLVPGWRTGWIIIHDRHNAFAEEIRPGLVALSQRILGANTIVQGALRSILFDTDPCYFTAAIDLVQKNAKTFFSLLQKVPGLQPIMPAGAMYMMVETKKKCFPKIKNDLDFTERLVKEQSVFCLPGACFEYPNYFRVVLTVPEDKVKEAGERIAQFCHDHYVQPGDAILNGNQDDHPEI